MIAAMFQNRSGRVIALCRLVLALVFFIALWIDPAQPVRASQLGYLLIGAYLALAVALMAIAATNWWWDHLLGWPVLALDVLAFLATVFFTEGVDDDFTSPFLAFFSFLMLATTIRWNWRVTGVTALVVTGLYLLVGIALETTGIEIDIFRFGRRIAYMIVLSLILIWFGLQRREQYVSRFSDALLPAQGLLPPLSSALEFAIGQCGARSGAIAWSDSEEPAIELRTLGLDAPDTRLEPTVLPEDQAIGDTMRLFSADRRRSLRATIRGRPAASAVPVVEPLADLLGIGEALAVPFAGGTGRGEIILTGIPGICADHVAIGGLVARELQTAFDRHATLLMSHETALARSRSALARDLHDSVAQSLAGAALRLEGLRKSILAGHNPDAEILELKAALRSEQQQVRGMIDRLRQSEQRSAATDLIAVVARLATELSKSWGIMITSPAAGTIEVAAEMAYEIGNLLREAVANAVRHGQADRVTVGLQNTGEWLTLDIADNGSGLAPGTGPDAPRSISERVSRQGGALVVQTGPSGTRLKIGLPVGVIT